VRHALAHVRAPHRLVLAIRCLPAEVGRGRELVAVCESMSVQWRRGRYRCRGRTRTPDQNAGPPDVAEQVCDDAAGAQALEPLHGGVRVVEQDDAKREGRHLVRAVAAHRPQREERQDVVDQVGGDARPHFWRQALWCLDRRRREWTGRCRAARGGVQIRNRVCRHRVADSLGMPAV
jgi:hypothetical protein